MAVPTNQYFTVKIDLLEMRTEINFGDYWYQFVGAAFGSPYNNAEYQEDRRRRSLQFLSYIRPIILKIDFRVRNFTEYILTFRTTAFTFCGKA